ncbi:MAG TPA: hypothetical protein GX017_06750 [Clostridiales bacterium]|nr:hypothetical protein [Clostridiales bacterium]
MVTILQLLLSGFLFGIFPDSQFYQWLIGLLNIIIFCVVIYADASSYGQNDLKRGTFRKSKGFLSGFIASIPGLILYILAVSMPSVAWFTVILRIWLIPFVKLIVTFEKYSPDILIVFLALFPLITGFSYLDGIRRREKVKKAIEKKEAMRVELSKRNS